MARPAILYYNFSYNYGLRPGIELTTAELHLHMGPFKDTLPIELDSHGYLK